MLQPAGSMLLYFWAVISLPLVLLVDFTVDVTSAQTLLNKVFTSFSFYVMNIIIDIITRRF